MGSTGWAESFYGTGIRRDHRVACPTSKDRRTTRRCKCPFSFWAVIDGERERKKAASYAEAKRLKAWYAAQQSPRAASSRVVESRGEAQETVRAHFARWMRWGETGRHKPWSPATIANRDKAWRLCIEGRIDHLPVSSITPSLLDEWIEQMLAEGRGHRSAQMAFETIRALLGRLTKRRVVEWNAALVVDFPPPARADDRVGERDFLLPVEYRQLLTSLSCLRGRTLVRLATEAAMRRGELCALVWNDIDFDADPCLVTVSRTVVRGDALIEKATKGDSLRAVAVRADEVRVAALSNPAVSDLLAYRRQLRERGAYDPEGRVFPSGRAYRDTVNPTDPAALTRWCTRTMKAVGLAREDGSNRFSLHDLRRTGATLAREGGVAEDVIRDQLGHSDTGISRQAYIRNRVNPHIANFADVFEQIGDVGDVQ